MSAHWLAHVSLDSSTISNSNREQVGAATFLPHHDNWVVPFTCYGSQCCLAPKCFLLKMNILGCSLNLFMYLSVVFGSIMFFFLTQNQHFGWFPSLFYGSQCCVALKCSLLKLLNYWIWNVRSFVWATLMKLVLCDVMTLLIYMWPITSKQGSCR